MNPYYQLLCNDIKENVIIYVEYNHDFMKKIEELVPLIRA